MSKILTSHVGSLPRSQEIVDFIFARENDQPYDQGEFDAAMAAAVDATVGKQARAGIDIVSDGETSKISYATYVKDRYTGFSGDSPRNAPADLKMFPSFLERLANDGGSPQYARPMCTGEVKSKGQGELQKDINNLKSAMAKHGVDRGFMNAASPGVISLFLQNDFYGTRDAYLAALADAMREEYETIVASGLDLQLDCPDLALSRHMLFNDLSDAEFVKVAASHVEALNYALENVPEEKVRIHICWGNYEGPHCCDIPMDTVFSTLMSAKARYVLFETSNPRHAHEWTVFRDRKSEIPDGKVLVPGVVDTTTNFVEHPELVAQRLERFVDIVGHDRVVAGSDCGFGTFAGFGAVDPEIAYAKLGSLVQGGCIDPVTSLVLLPGMMCDARLFAPQIASLGGMMPVHVGDISAYDTVTALAQGVLDHAPDEFALAGLSLGGIIAMEILRLAPKRVTKLALMDTNPRAEFPNIKAQRAVQMAAVQAGHLDVVMREEMKPNYIVDSPNKPKILDLCMAMAIDLGAQVFINQSKALRDRPDQQETLQQYRGSALVLCGRHDQLCPVERHQLMQDLLPNSRLAIVENAGHLPTLEQPKATTTLLMQWLDHA